MVKTYFEFFNSKICNFINFFYVFHIFITYLLTSWTYMNLNITYRLYIYCPWHFFVHLGVGHHSKAATPFIHTIIIISRALNYFERAKKGLAVWGRTTYATFVSTAHPRQTASNRYRYYNEFCWCLAASTRRSTSSADMCPRSRTRNDWARSTRSDWPSRT